MPMSILAMSSGSVRDTRLRPGRGPTCAPGLPIRVVFPGDRPGHRRRRARALRAAPSAGEDECVPANVRHLAADRPPHPLVVGAGCRENRVAQAVRPAVSSLDPVDEAPIGRHGSERLVFGHLDNTGIYVRHGALRFTEFIVG